MFYIKRLGIIICFVVFNVSCKVHQQTGKVFESEQLVITQITDHVFVHTSYLQTQDFGNVPCNGMIILDGKEAIVFDTPSDDATTELLISWIQETQKSKIRAVIATHFHLDAIGGLDAVHQHQIPSYAYQLTNELASEVNQTTANHSFDETLTLQLNRHPVTLSFEGEGHTKDNIIGYYEQDKVLFGGCLIKSLEAGKGNLEDANINQWSQTVRNIKQHYPNIQWVIPGHGDYGDTALLDYTIKMFAYAE